MADKKNDQKESPRAGPADAGISKQEAVRRALAELGHDAKPAQMQGWIRDRLGIEMSTDHISTAKGNVLKKQAGKGKSKGKERAGQKSAAPREAKEPAGPQVQPSSPTSAARGGRKEAGIPLTDILYVKALVGRFGPEQLHTLIDAFAR